MSYGIPLKNNFILGPIIVLALFLSWIFLVSYDTSRYNGIPLRSRVQLSLPFMEHHPKRLDHKVAILVVSDYHWRLREYEWAQKTLKCYARLQNYTMRYIFTSMDPALKGVCNQTDVSK
ncbi:hypothetical protein DdX_14558 [Ditylenchus destructor]|uniref:Uncharacterized protein n=1 Tax=Ditylenchus destructor TaxID=166010 RepID=A0AAD4MRL9_9BILA|nr:hypothetical protein DdX_14558 [Ditylenchus destructor]